MSHLPVHFRPSKEGNTQVKEEIIDFPAAGSDVPSGVAPVDPYYSLLAHIEEQQAANEACSLTQDLKVPKEEVGETQLKLEEMIKNWVYNENEGLVVKEEIDEWENYGQPAGFNEIKSEGGNGAVKHEMPLLSRFDVVDGEDFLVNPSEDQWEDSGEEEDEEMDQSEVEAESGAELDCPVDDCYLKFTTSEQMEEHVATHPPPLFCGVCIARFSSPPKLLAHYQRHTGRCVSCSLFFTSGRRMQNHLCDSTKIYCPHCPSAFADDTHLAAHLQRMHGEITCFVCRRRFDSRRAMLIHRYVHKLKKAFPCKMCPLSYTMRQNLRHHMRTKHEK